MRADRSIVLGWLSEAAGTIVTDAEDAKEIAERIAAAPVLPPVAFAAEIVDIARIIAENVYDEAGFATLSVVEIEAGDSRDGALVLCAVALSLSAGRVSWPSRQAARSARSVLQARAEAAYAVAARLGADFYGWLRSLAQIAIRLVSEIAANTAPLVRVETGVSIPSTVAAYHLYGDANRAAALVDAARSATPMLMPTAFDALAG